MTPESMKYLDQLLFGTGNAAICKMGANATKGSHDLQLLSNSDSPEPFSANLEMEQRLARDTLFLGDDSRNATVLDERRLDWEEAGSNEGGSKCSSISPRSPEAKAVIGESGQAINLQLKAERPNECVACGRAAHCCHFDVPSCLGCRSFFRRSILGQRHYVCHKSGQCRIEKGEMCRACRLDRCIMSGMNIQTIRVMPPNTDLAKLVAKLEKRRLELLQKIEQKSALVKQETILADKLEMNVLGGLQYSDDKLLRIRYSDTDFNEELFMGLDMLEIVRRENNLLAKANTFLERRRVPRNFEYFVEELSKGNFCVARPNWLHVDTFLCLELAKTVPAVRQLSLEDKTLLLSVNLLPVVVLSQCFYSVCMENNDMVVFPSGFTPLYYQRDELEMSKFRRLFCHHAVAYKRIQMDRLEFLLLRVIVLLQTASVDLSIIASTALQCELERCSKALMSYERGRLGDSAGAQRYAELMFFVHSILGMGKEHRNFIIKRFIGDRMCRERKCPNIPSFMENVILGIGGRELSTYVRNK